MIYYSLTEKKYGKFLAGMLLFALLYLTRTGLTASALVGINRAQFLTLGIICAVDGLRVSLKAMEQMSRNKNEQKPPVSFNEHD